MIVLSRPTTNYKVAFGRSVRLSPEAKGLYFYPRGRDALLVALIALRIMPGNTLVVPAYICVSALDPLRQAGYQIVFIDIKRDFQLDPIKVLDVAEACGAKAVLAIHYFGFPSNVSRLTALLRPRGIRVIEDCCHSFLTHSSGKLIGSQGDAAIFSMRKTLPIPDGGALRLNVHDFDSESLNLPIVAAPNVMSFLAIRAVEEMVASVGWPFIYSQTVDKIKKRFQGVNKIDEQESVAHHVPRRHAPSSLLTSYLSNEDYLLQVRLSITTNYARIVEGLLGRGLQAYISDIPAGCVPQWVPLYDPSGLSLSWLREHGVGASRWPWHELPVEVAEFPLKYPVSNELNSNLVLIPVHHCIGPRQIKRMLDILAKQLERPPISRTNAELTNAIDKM